MAKSVEKRNVHEAAPGQDGRNGQGGKGTTSAKNAPLDPARSQMDSFEEGMRLFHARNFKQAREGFQQAMIGPERSVSHRAGLHARMCEQRLDHPAPEFNSPEEHYNYAVTLMNSRDLAGAQKHLRAALAGDASADHVLYALAACQSLGGDLQAAYENLKRAIDLQPRNRLAARQDPDFGALAEHPAFARLVYPDRKMRD